MPAARHQLPGEPKNRSVIFGAPGSCVCLILGTGVPDGARLISLQNAVERLELCSLLQPLWPPLWCATESGLRLGRLARPVV